MELLKLKNDYTFKRVFGFTGNEQITKGLLNAILDEEVTEVSLDCDKILERDIYDEKLGILDIRAKVNGNIDCDIEMQLIDQDNIEKRMLHYVSRMYARNLKSGHDYVELNKCIGIVFVDFELEKLKEIPKYATKWNIRENEFSSKILTDVIELYIIELPKVEQYAKNSKLDTWVKYIIDSGGVDMESVDEDIKQAQKVLEDISKDKYEQYLADLREKYILDMNNIESTGIRKGINSIAKKMKKKGIDIDTIIEITELTKEEIEKL